GARSGSRAPDLPVGAGHAGARRGADGPRRTGALCGQRRLSTAADARRENADIGHGYTPDQGATYPFRGAGIGLMPELREVFAALPEGRFLINFKSREAREGDMLAALLRERPEWRSQVWAAYGGDEPARRAAGEIEGLAV